MTMQLEKLSELWQAEKIICESMIEQCKAAYKWKHVHGFSRDTICCMLMQWTVAARTAQLNEKRAAKKFNATNYFEAIHKIE